MHKNLKSYHFFVKIVATFMFAAWCSSAIAANFCFKSEDDGEWPRASIFLTGSPNATCSTWANASFGAHLISFSVTPYQFDMTPFGGSGFCRATLDNDPRGGHMP